MKKYIVWTSEKTGNRIIKADTPWDAAVKVTKEFCLEVDDITNETGVNIENNDVFKKQVKKLRKVYDNNPLTLFIYVRPAGRIKNPEKYKFPIDPDVNISSFSVAHIMQDLGYFGDFNFYAKSGENDVEEG